MICACHLHIGAVEKLPLIATLLMQEPDIGRAGTPDDVNEKCPERRRFDCGGQQFSTSFRNIAADTWVILSRRKGNSVVKMNSDDPIGADDISPSEGDSANARRSRAGEGHMILPADEPAGHGGTIFLSRRESSR